MLRQVAQLLHVELGRKNDIHIVQNVLLNQIAADQTRANAKLTLDHAQEAWRHIGRHLHKLWLWPWHAWR